MKKQFIKEKQADKKLQKVLGKLLFEEENNLKLDESHPNTWPESPKYKWS